jgi:hypothetical protein
MVNPIGSLNNIIECSYEELQKAINIMSKDDRQKLIKKLNMCLINDIKRRNFEI